MKLSVKWAAKEGRVTSRWIRETSHRCCFHQPYKINRIWVGRWVYKDVLGRRNSLSTTDWAQRVPCKYKKSKCSGTRGKCYSFWEMWQRRGGHPRGGIRAQRASTCGVWGECPSEALGMAEQGSGVQNLSC